ncbi:hypothetical protein CPA56_07590 [Bombella sp. TMW2.1889]|uniref:Uncharacterized protein n=1 Tax=Bombella mellum TaxID=2039288 RepID=A0ABR5ZUG7_9PROT|nr:hypothetical protein [Bombella mellum]
MAAASCPACRVTSSAPEGSFAGSERVAVRSSGWLVCLWRGLHGCAGVGPVVWFYVYPAFPPHRDTSRRIISCISPN